MKTIGLLLILAGILFPLHLSAQLSESSSGTALNADTLSLPSGLIVKIDNRLMKPSEEYIFKCDEPIKFEAFHLKPNSQVVIRVKKLGINIEKETFIVPESGNVFHCLETP